MKRRLSLCLLAAPLLVLAQPRPNFLEKLQRMSPQERRRFLDRIPPDRRLELERRLRQLEEIPPDVRERLRREYDEFQQLPAERQEAIRKVLKQLNELPPPRRGPVRNAIGMLRHMSPAQREDRMNGRHFKNRFDEAEQRLIREALETLPALPPKPEPSEEKL